MTTHVFIVDSTTFKFHLEYLFVGTGAEEWKIDFNDSQKTSLPHATENMLIDMIADLSRIRCGDQIIFYLQEKLGEVTEGKFFGIFKVKDNCIFLDDNDGKQYLKNDLKKSLTFRAIIEPHEVYEECVTVTEVNNITSHNWMLYSLINRKHKGNRGNTMITFYEAERLIELIRKNNDRQKLNCQNKVFSFDRTKQQIVCFDKQPKKYAGRKENINFVPWLIKKYLSKEPFESHLRAYIIQNIGRRTDESLDATVLNGAKVEWIGNEVCYGLLVRESIDIMLSVIQDGQKVLIPIKLTSLPVGKDYTEQITEYVNWIQQYYIPNCQSDIQPVLIAQTIRMPVKSYPDLHNSFNSFNKQNKDRCTKLKYIEFHLDRNDNLYFEEIQY